MLEQKKKMISRLLNSFLFILCALCSINYFENPTASGFTNETDREALLAMKHLVLSDPFRALSSWNASLHFCTWHGVACGSKHQRVIALNLSSLQLAGFLSPHIGNLTFLRRIDLSKNNFHGTIPEEVGQLFRLQYLSLSNNSFQDELPGNLSHCSNLRFLGMEGNNLTGKIPSELGSLSNLRALGLLRNHLTGSLPRSFGNLSSLVSLSLRENNLEGSIPIEFERLSRLAYLDLSFNNLSGMVPEELYNISSLSTVAMVSNNLSGRLPLDLGLTLPNLQTLYLGLNRFLGPVPASIVNSSGLEYLDLASNSFSGPVPKNLGSLRYLQILNFGFNKIGDKNNNDLTFLTSLTNCTDLKEIGLYKSNLGGLLPNSIANLSTNLYYLVMWGNYITGTIPTKIGNLKSSQALDLADNMLTGRLPESIGKLVMLKEFYVHLNKISGEIPSALGNISGLLKLDLGVNLLEGTIPVSLANCTSLNLLDISHNHLSGFIPEKIFSLSSLTLGLLLGSNRLSGRLPSQVVNMRNLIQLDISRNKICGEIPSTLETCLMLETLNMSGNFLRGTIPSSFKKLRSIRVLDVSCNNLSGQIPEFLADLPFLSNLNLSFNEFEGKVPAEGAFENASQFSIAGNNKLCGGIKAIQLPECPRTKQHKRFSKRVVIIASSVAVFITLLLACIFAVGYRKLSANRKPLSASTMEKKFQIVSYQDLARATDGFSSANMIGDGGYGSVYKGILGPDGQTVAIKVLKPEQRGANRTFVAECETLRRIRHRNLVKIVTACSSIDFKGNDFKALVFDFMPGGSLESWLHPSTVESQNSKRLSLLQRISMLIDVASAFDYLHNHCDEQIVHCDLKPSNILLDNDLTAHVGDFGLARILSAATGETPSTSTSSLGVRGTVGYVAPGKIICNYPPS